MSKNLLARILMFTFLLMLIMPSSASAYTPPYNSSQSWYVFDDWHNNVTFNGQTKLLAYQKGYQSGIYSDSDTIALIFGQQLDPNDVDAVGHQWSVYPYGGTGGRSNQWVAEVAQAFIQGVKDGHTTLSPKVIIATTNSNHDSTLKTGWTCNNGTSIIDSRWNDAGRAWGTMMSTLTSPTGVTVRSGNDMEAWDKEFADGWTACGLGAEAWMSGLSATYGGLNVNLGSQGNAQLASQWTPANVYNVSYGFTNAVVIPQIYCSGQETGWVNLRSQYFMRFWGVSSMNSRTDAPCGASTLSWGASWSKLDNALFTSLKLADQVDRVVTSWQN